MSKIDRCCTFKCSWCGKFTKGNELIWLQEFMELSGWHEHYPVCKKCHSKENNDSLINQLNHDSHINHKENTCLK